MVMSMEALVSLYKSALPFGSLLIANARERQGLITPLEYCKFGLFVFLRKC